MCTTHFIQKKTAYTHPDEKNLIHAHLRLNINFNRCATKSALVWLFASLTRRVFIKALDRCVCLTCKMDLLTPLYYIPELY